MPTQDIVRWLRHEHDDAHELASRLRERIASPPRGGKERWIVELRDRFDGYGAQIRQRMAEEEKRGYLTPLLQIRPSLSGAVDVLRHEHDELARLIELVGRSVHQLVPKHNLLLRDCCKRMEDLLCWVERHEEHENHMVLYALVEDGGREAGAV
jgi:hemerythrin-like domain-containing protein